MKNILSFTIAFLFYFVAISQTEQQLKQKIHQQKSLSNDLQIQATNLRSDTIDILNYNISLNITDFITNVIKGNTQVKFTPKINGISQIKLDLLLLTIDSIKVGPSILTYTYDDTLLVVNLPAVYNINDTIVTTVYYHGTPVPDASWGGFYFQSGFAYNMGVGFDALPHVFGRVWFPCFDNFIERSSYEFNITTNGGKMASCNGYLASDTTDGGGLRTRKWIMNETIPSYLACVAVATFTQVNQSYNGISGTIPIVLTALPSDTTNIKNSFINLPVALSTFENHFGPFMWNKVGYLFVPFAAGAMEHATNISYPRTFAPGSLTYQFIMAHELSHHWFGDLATCRTAEDMWLNEGWAHYCEFLFFESLSGYPIYLNYVRQNHEDNLHFNTPKEGVLTLSNIPQTFTYGDHVYNKGADIAHTMRGYLRDSLFFYSVKTYLSQNNFKDVSSTDFMNALTSASGVDMTDFFNGWVFNPGWPHFSIDSTVVTPSGPNFNVTVYVKQKLTDAPAYFNNVPLEVTFKSSNWTENTQTFIMSGANASFNFIVPFNPVFVAVNMGEKISHAVAPEIKTLKSAINYNFINAKMNITVQSITDSAFVRVEHNYTAPDPFKNCCIPYRLSTEHYWKIDGILPNNFKAKAIINYDGRTSSFTGNMWLDDQLITASEDSLVLMYRSNAASEWAVYPYYTKNMISLTTDKRGIITIDTMQLGEYAFAMMDYTLGIHENTPATDVIEMKIYPNPSKENVTIDLYASFIKIPENSMIVITDVSGKIIFKEKIRKHDTLININTNGFSNGLYVVSVKSKDSIIAKSKFIVAH